MIPASTRAVATRLPHHSTILLLLGLALLFSFFFASAQQSRGHLKAQLGGRTFRYDISSTSSLRLQPLRNLLWGFFYTHRLLFHLPQGSPADPDLTAHEWGTFASIAGNDGRAINWLPLTDSTDLPTFVEHLREPDFKGGLRGTVRMETPVLYFYSPRETTVSVKVSFAKGLITEWYPHSASAAAIDPRKDFSLYLMQGQGAINWDSVHIEPGGDTDFSRDATENHYYAARETSAAPVRVQTPSGDQRERFLFYRGVSALTPPLSATLSPDGTVLIHQSPALYPKHLSQQSQPAQKAKARHSERSLRSEESLFLVAQKDTHNTPDPISNVILFERRGDKIGYHILGPFQDQAALTPPVLNGSLDFLFSSLEGMLISQGLYADEAHAMLETWKTSWFQEGSRLIYIVPRSFVDSVLPLSISPTPAETVRVFVGRLELITPATEQAVESAFASGDRATLAKYSRFLQPILQTMIQQSSDPAHQQCLTNYLNSVYTDLQTQPGK